MNELEEQLISLIVSEQSTIYFHVGLGKVASTYLQKSVFTRLDGIYYIPTGSYKQSKQIISKSEKRKFLVSREFDRQFEEEVKWFTGTYPEAKIIMLLRRHDDWIASQYKRHVKNGFFHPFESFVDLEDNQGYWDIKELDYQSKLEVIKAHCIHPPLILFYEDFQKDAVGFLKELTDYLGIDQLKNVSTKVVHRSFNDKQLKVLRSFCRRFVKVVPTNHRNKWKHWLLYRPVWAFYHLILYLAVLLPDSWVSNDPLIHKSSLDKVRQSFDADWQAVKSAAAKEDL